MKDYIDMICELNRGEMLQVMGAIMSRHPEAKDTAVEYISKNFKGDVKNEYKRIY